MGPRRILAAFVLAAVLASAAGASDVFDHPVVAGDDSALRTALSEISRWETVKGRFEQEKLVTRINRRFESSGRFLFSGAKGIVWSVEKPFPSESVLMETMLVQRSADGRSSVLDASENPIFTSFASAILSVFSGDYEALSRYFSLYFIAEGERRYIGLKPRDDGHVSGVIDSLVLEAGDHLESLVMTEAGGDTITYRFEIQETRNGLQDDEIRLFEY